MGLTVEKIASMFKWPINDLITVAKENNIDVSSAGDEITNDEAKILKSKILEKNKTEKGNEQKIRTTVTTKTTDTHGSASRKKGKSVVIEHKKKRKYRKKDGVIDEKEIEIEKEVSKAEDIPSEEPIEKLDIPNKKIAPPKVDSTKQKGKLRNAKETKPIEKKSTNKNTDDPYTKNNRPRKEEKFKRKYKKATEYDVSDPLEINQENTGEDINNNVLDSSNDVSILVKKENKHGFQLPKNIVKDVDLPAQATVQQLARKINTKLATVLKALNEEGIDAKQTTLIEYDIATIIAEKLGYSAKLTNEKSAEDELRDSIKSKLEQTVRRPPVVTVMGHVDHGKTTLLDNIRKTQFVDREAGGITQHIGAYSVEHKKHCITFLDTPGHEAFTTVRARGAQVTDIVVLVVAADDGVMPQTLEAVQHAQAAEVPIVVAINKIDQPENNSEQIRNDLAAHGLSPEEWGGDTQFVAVSAKQGEGIENLLEAILLQSEILDLEVAVDAPAQGTIVETRLDKGQGVLATVIMQQGVLKCSDIIIVNTDYAKVRTMLDDQGKPLKHAGPSTPLELSGFNNLPDVGSSFEVCPNEKLARKVVDFRKSQQQEQAIIKANSLEQDEPEAEMDIDAFFESATTSATELSEKTISLVLKADTTGSSEALVSALGVLSNNEVSVTILSSGVGGIKESDVNLASTANATIIGFNVRADKTASETAEKNHINIIYNNIIYEIVSDIEQQVHNLMAPQLREKIVGLAEVREVFNSPKFGQVAGCMVVSGSIKRNLPVRILRDDVVVFDGHLDSLRRFKENVQEVINGTECGVGLKNHHDISVGDHIEVYEKVELKKAS